MQRALFRVLIMLACLVGTVTPSGASATLLEFTVHTSALNGQNGTLVFDFIGDHGNTARISGFTSDGSAAGSTTTGNTTGNLPSSTSLRTGANFFNESTLDFMFGSLIRFTVELSGNASVGSVPDALSLFFLDGGAGLSLFATSDPTGADALFVWNGDGTGVNGLNLYQSAAVSISAAQASVDVPEPGSLWLVLPALALLGLRRARASLRHAAMAMGIAALSFSAVDVQAVDLGSKVSVSKGGLVLNRTTDTFDSIVTVTNTSATTLAAPMFLTIKNITAPGVSVYNSSAIDDQNNAQVQAMLNLGVLAPSAKAVVPVKFSNPQHASFNYTVSVSGALLDAGNSAPLNVTVYGFSGDDSNPAGVPAGAGVKLYIDGILRGITNAAGKASFVAPLDATSISARRPPSEVGTAELQFAAGQANAVTIVLSDDGEVYADAALRIDQVRSLLLPRNFSAFSMRFVGPADTTAKVVDLASVELLGAAGDSQGEITTMFALGADGVIRPADINALRSFLASYPGRLTLRVTAIDAQDNVYLGSASFHIARNPVSGSFIAPASFPGLQLGGIRIVGKILNTDIVVSTVSDAGGNFFLPDLPNGNLSYTSETFQNDRFYYGAGIMSLSGATSIDIPLLSAADSAQASMMAMGTSAPAARADNTSARRPEDLGSDRTVWPALPGNDQAKTMLAAATSATVSVTAQNRDDAITQTATLTIPKGTTRITLTYNVGTAEYPYYVTEQSIYNDVWGIKLFAGAQGSQIFDITRQVNSQLTQDPVWRADGTTGVIEQSFDVTTLAKNSDIELALIAFATNIGDSALATTVNATVETGAKLTINAVSMLPTGWTAHNTNYFSVPASGAMNHFQRKTKLDITKPGDAKITNLQVEVIAAGAASIALDEGPGANMTTPNASTVSTIVTFKTHGSSLDGTPPPSSTIEHRYTIKATTADGSELTAELTDTRRKALWRMPAGFARYSTREAGGDDWASRRTYDWMATNTHLLTAINDVSGEHSKDLGHASHDRGSDIDMYHFYRFQDASAASGTSNYNVLLALLRDLPKLNSPTQAVQAVGQAARNELRAWIAASRAGIDALAADANVLKVGYIRGGPGSADIGGAAWGQTLLTTGRVTVNGVLFDLGSGAWTNAKYHAWANHHHHVHVTLNPAD